MSGYYNQRNRDRGQYRGQNSGGGNFNQNSNYQNQGSMNRQVVNPWQGGMVPTGGSGFQERQQSDEAALAFNILNQVLSSDSVPMSSGGQGQRRFQDQKPRQMNFGNRLNDRRQGGQYNQFQKKNRPDQSGRQWSNRSRSPHGREGRGNSNSRQQNSSNQNRRSITERLGKQPEKRKKSGFIKVEDEEYTPADKRRKSNEKDSQSSDSKLSSKEDSVTKDDENPSSPKKEKTQKKKENEELIRKCLRCHICEVDSFVSLESFRQHKRREEHKLLADLYHRRSDAVLQLLRIDSKLASNREREKTGNANKETFYTTCAKCDCIVSDAFKSHKKTTEHELVDNHIFRECCGSTFMKRKEFEDHRLTVPHLKKQGEVKKENKEEEKAVLAFTDQEEAAAVMLSELKQAHRMKLECPADYPEYDENTPTGLDYFHKKRRYNCSVCKKNFPNHNSLALAHCRSFNHYLNLMGHLQTKLPEVANDIVESDTEEKPEDEKEEQEAEKAGNHKDEKVKEKELKADQEDTKEGKQKEDQEEEGNENQEEEMEGDEEMGEILPPLEDGGIILEDVDKAAEDEGEQEEADTELEEQEEVEAEEQEEVEAEEQEEVEAEDDAEEEEQMATDEQDQEILDEQVPEECESTKDVEETEFVEAAEEEDVPSESDAMEKNIEAENEEEEKEEEEEEEDEDEEEEEEVVVVVKKTPAKRGRRGRGRGKKR